MFEPHEVIEAAMTIAMSDDQARLLALAKRLRLLVPDKDQSSICRARVRLGFRPRRFRSGEIFLGRDGRLWIAFENRDGPDADCVVPLTSGGVCSAWELTDAAGLPTTLEDALGNLLLRQGSVQDLT